MLVPLSWLKDYVDIDITPKELEEKLFSCGFEVEESYEAGKDISGVVAGKVLSREPIPDTHLNICMVDIGEAEPVQILCGADNVRAGGVFPVAKVGATVYQTAKDHVTVEGVATIGAGKMRGYDSFGMLCSGTELGINDNMYPGASYNGLLVLPEDTVPGTDVKPLLGLDDWIFDIAITANRPDCLSVFGMAREVAAILEKPVKTPDLSYTAAGSMKEIRGNDLTVKVEAPDLCPRYIGHYVYDVKMGESPLWMKRRLHLVGIEAISNIVDITNFILKELGQPMHAFDASFLQEDTIIVRRAAEGEKIQTLDEKEFTLTDQNLVICDAHHPVALAGIMGGLNSEITDNTKDVVFEAAKFARDNIRKSSRALGQSSDSSQVFAKGVNEYTTVMAMERALHLIEELGCGKVSGTHCDVNTGNSIDRRTLKVSVKRVNGVLGITVPDDDIVRILKNLDMQPELSGDELTLHIPGYREDMEGYQDVAEEVIREYGYDHVVPTFMPTAEVTVGGRNLEQAEMLRLKRALNAQGAFEGIHYSFFSPADLDLLNLAEDAEERKAIRLINPINEDLSLMRTTLLPQMIRSAARNQKRKTMAGRLFEIGSRFIPKSLPLTDYPEEKKTLAIGVFGPEEDFFTLKGLTDTAAETFGASFSYRKTEVPFLHPYRTAAIYFEGGQVGVMGQIRYELQDELDMRWPVYVAEIDLEALSKNFGLRKNYKPLPKFDIEKRDFAFVVD
ncbi:MAG: phenylalanine--tRNA ligase subunit beta, partial [Lachnospiraceae bacterium]|nr:phenylalanine--tRNA ligase subunit beta [Lachnospiraceae bacterium]